ncbi:hypothetical protein PAAG_11556 [Paracoccidioides lutzii Pb01]|uniref:Berberine/berberine-like domain-containing protein n=1 Tax=Paracoccidioides lutzii (strain ATCC MYA-826 / Pb01) TaxID=502779 RepID=A0A0A2VLJ2_PARBA|nr:hypothetical protein PAAG_11556 [Paracoccidioides lutzii Pb01]KGQ01709.1 hypothetical protein PAAG_11556 [Paracoccidioides lutzii Pb01]
MQKLLQLATAFLLAGFPTALSIGKHPSCRCKTDDSCWPSHARWKALNESIQGNPVAVRPVANVCHDPAYDPEHARKQRPLARILSGEQNNRELCSSPTGILGLLSLKVAMSTVPKVLLVAKATYRSIPLGLNHPHISRRRLNVCRPGRQSGRSTPARLAGHCSGEYAVNIDKVIIFTYTIASPKSNRIINGLLNAQGETDQTGVPVAKLGPALSSLKSVTGSVITGHIVAGGQVAKNAGRNDSALDPAWRKTLTHITFSSSWNSSTSFEEQKKIYERITKVQVPLLKALEPGQMGAYMNEADSHEVDLQKSFFWRKNYKRLYAIKKKWDPSGLFISRLGVGSEDWY